MVLTGFYAALLGLFFVFLSLNVIKNRRKFKAALGDNNNYELQRHIRGHANFIEYTPLFLILFGLLEYHNFASYGLYALGTLFVLARISHAYGVLFAEQFIGEKMLNMNYRIMGMAGTFSCIIIMSISLLVVTFFY